MPVASRRRQLGQAGPLALLVAGVLTFTISASVAVSLQLAPKRDLATSEPRPAAKTSPEAPAAVTHLPAPVAIPPAPVVEALPPAEAPPVEVAPSPVDSETPVGIPDAPAAVSDAPPGEAVPPEAAALPPPPEGDAVTPRAAGPARPACARRTPGNHQPDQGPAARCRRGRGTTRSRGRATTHTCCRTRAATERRPAPAATCLIARPNTLADVRVLRVTLRVAIVLAVVLAMVAVATSTRSGLLWRLSTFTYQANLLAAAYYLWSLAWPRADIRVGIRGAVVLYVLIAGVIWNLFLTGHSMGYTPANMLLHLVVPLLALTDWLLVGRDQAQVRWWQPVAWLAYPAAYLALALVVLNNIGRRAPYYFLDPGTIGLAAVVGNICVLAGGALALGYMLLVINRAVATVR